ncbi:DinB family protein [Ornithinibacillus xuwenensis]|uniref:DinB family protein n=1 Tax=Ornithinibacillus xuwenensis TaxID=3144668 RepID=A0ABU9XFL8_9BACI
MYAFFAYNWQVRDQWFAWCEDVPNEELLKDRIGGIGNILHTLLHIVDVEYSWVRAIQKKDDKPIDFSDYTTLRQVKALSDQYRDELEEYLQAEATTNKQKTVTASWLDGTFTKEEILHHIIAHEIHHIGQLSVWAREIGKKPVSATVLDRGLF